MTSSGLPLSGLIICLSGFQADEKVRLHGLVEQLGATYERDLNAFTTTHLVTPAPGKGAKYDMAVSVLSQSKSKQQQRQQQYPTKSHRLDHIVTPQWLTNCLTAGKRLPERDYSLFVPIEQNHGEMDLINKLEEALNNGDRKRLFLPCRFLMLSIDGDSKEQMLLEKLIHRGRGTIFWELNEAITHVLVMNGCDSILIDAADVVSTHHPLEPTVVSPQWVVECWNVGKLCSLTPYHRPRTNEQTKEHLSYKRKQVDVLLLPGNSEVSNAKRTSLLFRGSLFSLVRLSPPSGAVDFDANALTASIVSFGGQMLSSKVVEALRADQCRDSMTRRRNCYVVFWGGFSKTHISMHPLLSQIQSEKLCQLVLVSPIWLKTCIADGTIPSSFRRQPLLFQPQSWPLLRLHDFDIKLAVSGFVGAERSGLMELILAVGASYTEHLKPTNTHLICREAKGPKYEKAMEWQIHIVSVEWLFHVVQHGYDGLEGCGMKGTTRGCEAEFSL